LLDAAEHHRAGRFHEAESGYRRVLEELPRQADALHLLGVLCHQTARHAEAIEWIDRAIAVDGACADFHNNLGEAKRALGRSAQAEADYRRALALRPDYAEALCNLGLVLCELDRAAEAATHLRRAVALKPDLAAAHDNLGVALQALDDLDGAAAAHARAIALAPSYAKAHNNLGNVHFARDELASAQACYRRALEIDPDYPQAHYNLANVFAAREEFDAARAEHERAIALKPDYFDSWLNLGLVLQSLREADQAIALLGELAARYPDRAAAHAGHAAAIAGRADFAAADAGFRRAIALAPDNLAIWSALLFHHHYRADGDRAAHRRDLADFDAAFGGPLRATWRPHANDRAPDRRLRVGYVSPDFRMHSCAFFAHPLLAAHDPGEVEVYAYADVAKPDAMTQRFMAAARHWRPTHRKSDETLAGMIRDDRIDVLIDLAGHTAGSRLGVFARKPAPIQVNWLGYPGSTGLSAIDYRLTDAVADPPGAEADAVEQLVRLPDGFLCYEGPADAPDVSPSPAVAAKAVTFGCFNNAQKITAEVVALWARALRAAPTARLLIKAYRIERGNHRRRLEGLLAAHGVSPARIDIRPHYGGIRSHLATYAEVDVALDPFPYNGTTTTCEAQWLGVPTLTLRGDRHAGRVGASLMTAVGLPEFVAETPDDYVAKAVALAGDIDRLAALRRGLRGRMRASPLMDAPRFARAVEAAYRRMWRRWCAGGD
jgi:predicted O-linked N-acetylglucosamine transferase (SPINDLY family)